MEEQPDTLRMLYYQLKHFMSLKEQPCVSFDVKFNTRLSDSDGEEKNIQGDFQSASAQEVFKKSSACVKWSIKIKILEDEEIALNIRFLYYPTLELVTTKSKVVMSENLNESALSNCIINAENILSGICKDDFGEVNPNEKTMFLTQKCFGRGKNFLEYALTLGKPYIWAQRLAGIYNPLLTFEHYKKDFVFIALKVIKRFQEIVHLWLELTQTESRILGGRLDRFENWTRSSYQEYSAAKIFPMWDSVTPSDSFKKSAFHARDWKIELIMAKCVTYPRRVPRFSISVYYKGKKVSHAFKKQLKSNCVDLTSFPKAVAQGDQDAVLSVQLQKLFYALSDLLDTFTECEMYDSSAVFDSEAEEEDTELRFFSPPSSPDSASILT